MAKHLARKGKVVLGTYQVSEIGKWSISGMTNEILESQEFGDEFVVLEFGIGRFGSIAFDGSYDPGDTTGQALLESAWKNKSKITNLKLYINSTQYWTPDLTNNSDSAILMKEYGAIEFDQAGIGKISFSADVSGQLVLV